MDNFEYRNGALFAEDVAVSAIAEEFGTPAYIYSRDALERAYLAYAEALEGRDALVCYAVKANSNIAVLNVLARLGAGFDIVSEGELERVLQAGGQADKIVFSGVAKRESEMRRALEVGIHCFNIESEAELDRLNSVAEQMGKVAPISLRVNPDVDAGTHPYISTGLKDNKFGVAIEDAARIYAYANSLSHLSIQGLDCHIGSQLTETAPFIDALDRLLVLIDALAEQGITIQHLDLGGGLGVCYTDEVPPTPQSYIAEVLAKLGDRPLKLIFEPGRSIAANAGILVTKVEFLKCAEHKNFAIIDAAMNDMIRPSLYSAYMDIIPAQVREEGESRVYDLVGPVCETGDFLGKERTLNIQPGDLLAVCSAGAYGFTMSSNYNSRNRAVEVMVDDNHSHVIRQRETLADQLRGEQLLP
ncbi:diaminopimelate decarboxylase [Aliamphritea spongicola]|uniref:diaminopimelate decarboxylase n=1 Tax=Aliamphritea spongicola TaxID=707589 RepID=UPI00196A294A|nr:diaminopimelate decarboxylase [Aliamphritea spongicola]MBN3562422.1 diaminopimelate decarboxylase [Aliamphritea spongicola]